MTKEIVRELLELEKLKIKDTEELYKTRKKMQLRLIILGTISLCGVVFVNMFKSKINSFDVVSISLLTSTIYSTLRDFLDYKINTEINFLSDANLQRGQDVIYIGGTINNNDKGVVNVSYGTQTNTLHFHWNDIVIE